MSLLNVKFFMVYIIHKILVLVENHMNTIMCKIIFSNVFKKYNEFYFFKKAIVFITYNDGKSKISITKSN